MAMPSSKDESEGKEKQSQSSLSLIAVLKDGNYALAEEMIQDPINGSTYLDEGGRGGVKPLAMVMFGVLPGELIHLYLAKLMVEHGVDVNYRIRDLGYGSRFSCFEQLIDIILDINGNLKRQNLEVPHMIGINNQPVTSWTEARLHLIKLLKVFLEFQGNPNFRSRILGCSLFHKILRSSNPDVDVIRILHRAGGDINKVPIFGFPPIVSLINNSFFDSALPVVKEIWKPSQYKTYHHTFSGSNLVRRITTVANSALMVSMHSGSTETAIFFLKQGAQFDSVGIYNTNEGARYTISCLFLPLLHLSLSYFKYFAAVSLNTNEKYLKDYVFMSNHLVYDEKNCNKSLICKVVKSSLSPIVDSIVEHSLSSEENISRNDISEQDINSLIIRHSSYSSGIFFQQFSFTYLLSALFGQSTATLQQLCVRKIFDSIFFDKPTLDMQKLIHILKYPEFNNLSFSAELVIPDVKSMVNDITDVVINNLVNCLQLPPKLSILFHLEAARLQICLNLSAYECLDAFFDVPSRSPSRVSSLSDNLFAFNINESRTETDSDSGESYYDSYNDGESSEWDSSSDSSPSDDDSSSSSSSSSHPVSAGISFTVLNHDDDDSICDKHFNHSDTHRNDEHVSNNEISDEYDHDKSIPQGCNDTNNKNDYDYNKSILHNYNDTVNENTNGEDDRDKNCLHDYNELSESLSLSSVDSNSLSLS